MIRFDDVSKLYKNHSREAIILDEFSYTIPTNLNCFITGAEGSGKSTFLSLIGQTKKPSSGSVKHNLNVSWPVMQLKYQKGMSIGQNMRFFARIAGYDNAFQFQKEVQGFLIKRVPLKQSIDQISPVRRNEVSFAIAMCLPFDVFLFDHNPRFGSEEATKYYYEKMLEASKTKQFFFTMGNPSPIKELFDLGFNLRKGKVEVTDDFDEFKKWCSQNNS